MTFLRQKDLHVLCQFPKKEFEFSNSEINTNKKVLQPFSNIRAFFIITGV